MSLHYLFDRIDALPLADFVVVGVLSLTVLWCGLELLRQWAETRKATRPTPFPFTAYERAEQARWHRAWQRASGGGRVHHSERGGHR